MKVWTVVSRDDGAAELYRGDRLVALVHIGRDEPHRLRLTAQAVTYSHMSLLGWREDDYDVTIGSAEPLVIDLAAPPPQPDPS